MKQRLIQKQIQKFSLSPQMQQAAHILGLSLLDLRQVVEQEIQDNPLLEEVEQNHLENKDKFTKDKDRALEISRSLDIAEEDSFSNWGDETESEKKESSSFHDRFTTKSISLQESLMRQLRLTVSSQEQLNIGEAIIGNIDENGYLNVTLQGISQTLNIPEEKIKKVLSIIQYFEPVGVAARDLKECLLTQLRHLKKENTLTYKMVETSLEDVAHKRYEKLSKSLGVPIEQIKEGIKTISCLEPKPGRLFSRNEPIRPIIPDVALKIDNKNNCQIIINNEEIPRLRISPYYRQMLNRKDLQYEVEQFIKNKLMNASLLIKNIQQRYQTIREVSECIIQMQRDFFKDGTGALKPLTYQDVAKKVGRHESTICRVVTDKYMETPWGIFPFKKFFSGRVKMNGNGQTASCEVKDRIQRLIDTEDKRKPLSDQEIVNILSKEDINIARRTVTKYRLENRALPSNLRKI